MNTDKHDENIIAAYAAIPHDHGLRAKIATFDLVTAIMHCRVPSLALAQYARDETEYLVDERDALRAQVRELVGVLARIANFQSQHGSSDEAKIARAALAGLGEDA